MYPDTREDIEADDVVFVDGNQTEYRVVSAGGGKPRNPILVLESFGDGSISRVTASRLTFVRRNVADDANAPLLRDFRRLALH